MTDWIRCRRSSPCPICGKPDGCSVSTDGTEVCCARVESDKLIGVPFHGGYIHKLTDDYITTPYTARKKERPVPQAKMAELAITYQENARGVTRLSAELGVSRRSLERLQIGWNGECYTFPMRNEHEVVIGIAIRSMDGKKWMVTGSHPGLYWPEGIDADSRETLFLPEGSTDCAALLDLGFVTIGRPSNYGGGEILTAILKRRRRHVVIVADHDEEKPRPDGSTWKPGMVGAKKLAGEIKAFATAVKIIKPSNHKDVRAWYRDGMTRDALLSLAHHARLE